MLILKLLGRDSSDIGHCQILPVTGLELQSTSQFVAASAGPECAWEGPSCTPSLSSTSTKPWVRPAKDPKDSEICLYQLAVCSIQSLKECLSVASERFSVSHQVGVAFTRLIEIQPQHKYWL